jgi:hypothetical protein
MRSAGTDNARLRALCVGLAAACALALGLAAAGPAAAKQNGGIKADGNCPPNPAALSPKGSASNRFTMLLRINQDVNVQEYTDFTASGLGQHVRLQDVFVINTRYGGSNSAEWTELTEDLRLAFPCNRIVALNGMGVNPDAAGYAFALLDHPSVFSLMTDFEPMDWDDDPGRPSWSYSAGVAMKRIKSWNTRLAKVISASPQGASKRSGMVPLDLPGWNYGQIAQDLDRKNRRLGGTHLGPLSVQTQDSCADGGASTFSSRAASLFDQYRYRYIRKTVKRKVKGKVKKVKITIRRKIKKQARPNLNNLSLQISFSDTPSASSSMAITKTNAKTAAACARAGLRAGGGAFFFFASTDSMKLLFKQPEISSLRPSNLTKKK